MADSKNNAAEIEPRDGANVDKIRDILFGSQMRDYEKRFSRLEERLTKAQDTLREDLKKRFDALLDALIEGARPKDAVARVFDEASLPAIEKQFEEYVNKLE